MKSQNTSANKTTQVADVLNFKPSDVVRRSISDAELVLEYISEQGIEIDKKLIDTIVQAKEALTTNKWNRQIEEEFWMAYNRLSSAIQPITVDSIKAVVEPKILNPNFFQRLFRIENKTSLAFRSVRLYTIFAIVTMVIMLTLHIYFSIGTVRLTKIQKNDQLINEIENQINDLEMITKGSSETNLSVEFKKDKLYNQLFELNTEKESNIKLLREWLYFIDKILFFKEKNKPEEPVQMPDENTPPLSPQETLTYHIETINEAENYLLVIGYYILPLLYGLLGAMTFVLREMRELIKKLLFTKETNINFALRLILGTIAGVAVGVFWGEITQQQTLKFIQTLGQLLVAFIAGFLVEYVFIFLERSVKVLFDKTFFGKKENNNHNNKQAN